MKWIQQFADRQCRGSGRRAQGFNCTGASMGAASLGQDIQKSVCIGGAQLCFRQQQEVFTFFPFFFFFLRSLFF